MSVSMTNWLTGKELICWKVHKMELHLLTLVRGVELVHFVKQYSLPCKNLRKTIHSFFHDIKARYSSLCYCHYENWPLKSNIWHSLKWKPQIVCGFNQQSSHRIWFPWFVSYHRVDTIWYCFVLWLNCIIVSNQF